MVELLLLKLILNYLLIADHFIFLFHVSGPLPNEVVYHLNLNCAISKLFIKIIICINIVMSQNKYILFINLINIHIKLYY